MSRLLSAANWPVKQFSDPEKFLVYAKTHRPPIAVIDVWMPIMNGLEVQSQLGEISPSTRVIIFTGKEDPRVRSAALNAGASAFFTKPFDNQEFLTAVRMALAAVD
jgi:FixJ family two-component response regulator